MRTTTTTEHIVHFQYPRLAEFMADAMTLPRIYGDEKGANAWAFGEFGDSHKTERCLIDGIAPEIVVTAAELAQAGMMVQMEAAEIAPTRRRVQCYSDAGDVIDVDRMINGHDRPWSAVKLGRQIPIVRIGINFALSSGNEPQDFARIVGTAAAAAQCLTVAGYGVEIIGAACVATKGRKLSRTHSAHTFTLKSSDEPMDIQRVCSIGAPGLLREYWHRINQRDSGEATGICSGFPRHWWNEIGVDYLISRNHSAMNQVDVLAGIVSAAADQ